MKTLNENINRIKEVMGLITESNETVSIEGQGKGLIHGIKQLWSKIKSKGNTEFDTPEDLITHIKGEPKQKDSVSESNVEKPKELSENMLVTIFNQNKENIKKDMDQAITDIVPRLRDKGSESWSTKIVDGPWDYDLYLSFKAEYVWRINSLNLDSILVEETDNGIAISCSCSASAYFWGKGTNTDTGAWLGEDVNLSGRATIAIGVPDIVLQEEGHEDKIVITNPKFNLTSDSIDLGIAWARLYRNNLNIYNDYFDRTWDVGLEDEVNSVFNEQKSTIQKLIGQSIIEFKKQI